MELSRANIQKCLYKVESTIAELSLDQPTRITTDFLHSWEMQLDAQTTDQIEPGFKEINTFAEQCVAINEAVQKIVTNRHKQLVDIDKDALKRCQTQLCVWTPHREIQTAIRQVTATNEYNYANVVTMFEGKT